MDLKSLMVDSKTVTVDYPGMKGFEIDIATLSRKELTAIRKSSTITKFDRKTRQPVESLDEEVFVTKFAKATIKGWRGLKLEYLESLILIDTDGKDLEEELPYTEENAELLISNSATFDEFINEVCFDLERFHTKQEG